MILRLLLVVLIWTVFVGGQSELDYTKDEGKRGVKSRQDVEIILTDEQPEYILLSPGFPYESYPPDVYTEYQSKVSLSDDVSQLGARILLYFEKFMLEESVNCYKDGFDVQDNYTGQIRVFCGIQTGRTVLSEGNKINLRFFTDREIQEPGFKIKISIYKSTCSKTFTNVNKGVITSPNYSNKYTKDDICIWKIVAPSGQNVRLQFDRMFEIISSDEMCAEDYLLVSREGDLKKQFQRFCGKIQPEAIVSKSNTLLILFRSDCCFESHGFNATFEIYKATEPTVPPPTIPPDCRCGEAPLYEGKRIVDGKEVRPPHSFPWVVGLLDPRSDIFCGAALISTSYVLTAAHCLEKRQPSSIRALIGAHERKVTSNSIVVPIEEMFSHPNYEIGKDMNDIGLLRLERSVQFTDKVFSVCLPTYDIDTDEMNGTVAGWGLTEFGGRDSDILLYVTLPVITNAECVSKYGSAILDTNLCAGGDTKEDACQGDSGGPLFTHLVDDRWMAIGVVSWGLDCGTKGSPGVYTRISKYLNWIEYHAGDLCGDSSTPPTLPPPTKPNIHDCGIPNERAYGGRIVGGTEATPFEFPWMPVIAYNGYIQGTGAVISRRHVITSASCLSIWLIENYQYIDVFLGEHNVLKKEPTDKVYKVAKVRIHPRYDSSTYDYDFALLELYIQDDLPAIYRPICVPPYTVTYADDTECTVAGWGRKSSSSSFSYVLMKAQLNLINRDRCNQIYDGVVTRNMICAAAPNKDTCENDNGAPLMLLDRGRYYLVGVWSWGSSKGCAVPGEPSVFSAIHRVLAWIQAYADLS